MLLTKSCNQAHHVARSKTVKIATLSHYRKIEDSQTQDKDEGRLTFHISIEAPTWINKELFNALSQNGMQLGWEAVNSKHRFPGKSDTHIEAMSLGGQNETHVQIKKAEIYIRRESPDCLIYCMSMAKRTHDFIDVFPDYDDKWHILKANTHHLARELSESIYRKLESPGRGGLVSPELPYKELSVWSRHEPVIYTDRKICITNDTHFDLDSFLANMDFMSFMKPSSYKKESEYRFLFFITHNDRIIPLSREFSIFDISPKFMGFVL